MLSRTLKGYQIMFNSLIVQGNGLSRQQKNFIVNPHSTMKVNV